MDDDLFDFPLGAFHLADALRAGRASMLEPQYLPGRFGRVVSEIDELLRRLDCEAVLAGGWAVWRHGFEGRLNQELDIALPALRVSDFLHEASQGGFEAVPLKPKQWPKVEHIATGVRVDIMPEGARPGSASRPAPTTIPHPNLMGAERGRLKYITLPNLIELKVAAARAVDASDVVTLLLTNPGELGRIRKHLASVHPAYVSAFDHLVRRAEEDCEER